MIFVILGLGLVLFVPGFILSSVLIQRITFVERLCISIGLSMLIVVFMGFVLTLLNQVIPTISINPMSAWIVLIGISMLFGIIHLGGRNK